MRNWLNVDSVNILMQMEQFNFEKAFEYWCGRAAKLTNCWLQVKLLHVCDSLVTESFECNIFW